MKDHSPPLMLLKYTLVPISQSLLLHLLRRSTSVNIRSTRKRRTMELRVMTMNAKRTKAKIRADLEIKIKTGIRLKMKEKLSPLKLHSGVKPWQQHSECINSLIIN